MRTPAVTPRRFLCEVAQRKGGRVALRKACSMPPRLYLCAGMHGAESQGCKVQGTDETQTRGGSEGVQRGAEGCIGVQRVQRVQRGQGCTGLHGGARGCTGLQRRVKLVLISTHFLSTAGTRCSRSGSDA